jgi:cyclic dehypoxanthinyl futalosine synthase
MQTHGVEHIIDKALTGVPLTVAEGMRLFSKAPLPQLMAAAHRLRMTFHPKPIVTWIIDRNVNISNVCHAGCLFCNFSCSRSSERAFVTTMNAYRMKVSELFSLGGNQLLLQGGLHPDLGLSFYTELFTALKREYPSLRLHALGPPEIVHLARLEGISSDEVLAQLTAAGLDSLPGAGAEILSNRVRQQLSPGKCSTEEWLEVMHYAHRRNITTSATMMFGHVETHEERMEHLVLLRELQNQRPEGSHGFISFIPWPFQDTGTTLSKKYGVNNTVTPIEYIRFFAVARLILYNIPNMQPSWLTVGVPTAQICLHGGGNDFGSVMIEEHVVSSAGAKHRMDTDGIRKAIRDAGFTPVFRDQQFSPQPWPEE